MAIVESDAEGVVVSVNGRPHRIPWRGWHHPTGANGEPDTSILTSAPIKDDAGEHTVSISAAGDAPSQRVHLHFRIHGGVEHAEALAAVRELAGARSLLDDDGEPSVPPMPVPVEGPPGVPVLFPPSGRT
jgi:hypothetical protein